MNVIRKKQIKIIKLCLISPLLEQIINLLYLVSLPLFALSLVRYTKDGKSSAFSNYEITEKLSETLKESKFKNITTSSDYIIYLEDLLDTLYSYQDIYTMPYFIPVGSIRMKKYSINPSICNLPFCPNCGMDDLYKLARNNSKCFSVYTSDLLILNSTSNTISNSSLYDSFVKPLNGKFSSYDLISDGLSQDFNRDDYLKDKAFYQKFFLDDKNIKFLVIMYNVYSVYGQNYITVISGIEMLQYFSYNYNIFTTSIFNFFDTKEYLIFAYYVIQIACSVLGVLKLVYEMNLKFSIITHLCQFLHEVINLSLIVFYTIFMTASKSLVINDSLPDYDQYVNFQSLIAIKSYLMIMISLAIVSYPFRLISCFSWFRSRSKYLITYLNVIFRMLPGVLLLSITFSIFVVSFAFMLYLIYNEYFMDYASLSDSLLSIFSIITSLKDFSKDPKLIHSMNLSKYYIIYNFFISVGIFIIIFIIIATYTYLFKRASVLEVKKAEDEVIGKLSEIKEKIDALSKTEDNSNDKEDFRFRRQIIWLCLTNSNELYNEKTSESYKIMLFNSTAQIIAFLKYLFAIKPKMQFENLDKKFAIIIECKVLHGAFTLITENDLDQIDTLFDWLNFAGCRIPIAIHTLVNLDRHLKMSVSATYWNVDFINEKEEINEFFDMEKDRPKDDNTMNNNKTFTFNQGSQVSKLAMNFKTSIMISSKGPRFTVDKSGIASNWNNANLAVPEKKSAFDSMLQLIADSKANRRGSQLGIAGKGTPSTNSQVATSFMSSLIRPKAAAGRTSINKMETHSISEQDESKSSDSSNSS